MLRRSCGLDDRASFAAAEGDATQWTTERTLLATDRFSFLWETLLTSLDSTITTNDSSRGMTGHVCYMYAIALKKTLEDRVLWVILRHLFKKWSGHCNKCNKYSMDKSDNECIRTPIHA